MWYFSWILGMGLACTFSILNALWYEINSMHKSKNKKAENIFNYNSENS